MVGQVISTFFTPEVLLALIVGTLAGMLVGALPGLSASMAVALLIPITFKMSPAAGLTMLTAVYTSAIYGGSITACLDIMPRDEVIYGNVMTDSFTESWNNRFEIFRKHLSELNKDCKECEYEKWCAGGAHHSWDYDANKPLICLKDILF